MKSRNKQIAEIMKWVLLDPEYNGIDTFDTNNTLGTLNLWSMQSAKLLQARMVEDDWEVSIYHWKKHLEGFNPKVYFSAITTNFDKNIIKHADADTEEVVIVSLFCKAYGIK